jgi:hypothetical protein
VLQNVLQDGDRLAQFGAGSLAVAIAGWHLFGLVVCAVARACPARRGLPQLLRLSPTWARRLAGVVCTASIVLTPVTAHAATSTTTVAPSAADEPFVRAPAPTGPPPTVAAPAPVPPPAPAPAPLPSSASIPADVRTHVVVPGDNLWRLAAAELTRAAGDAHPADRAIATYWRALMDANRTSLRSGDPSLIFPGEIVVLPAH